MKKSKRGIIRILTIVSLLLFCKATGATNMATLRQQILDNLKTQPQERVYLSFDNTYYKQGENLYFKADVVQDPDGTATRLSSVLYVELLAPSGWIMERQKLKIINGHADGAFRLDDNIYTGLYEVRAYTAWMLNFTNTDAYDRTVDVSQPGTLTSKECWGIFSRVFPVYGKSKFAICMDNVVGNSNGKDDVVIKFYPESGNIIKGLPTRVAFECKDKSGRHVDVRGWLIDGKTKLRKICTMHDGKGVFDIRGEETLGKLAFMIDQTERKMKFQLPKPLTEGYSLKISEGPNIDTRIMRNSKTLGLVLGLSICCRGKMSLFEVVDMRNSMIKEISVCGDSLSTGVNVATLYDEHGTILAQREFFVNKHDMESKIDVILDEEKIHKEHEEIDASIKLIDKNTGNPIIGENFSVSVCQKEENAPQSNGNVMSYFLLSSELRGYVDNPQFYFEGDDSLRQKALDVLMMVQGWTRYDYSQLATQKVSVPKYPIERGLSLYGRILDAKYNSDIYHSSDYTGDGYFETQTDLGIGYGESKYWKEWHDTKKKFWLRMDLHFNNVFLTFEDSISSSDYFTFPIPQFYGNGMVYLMMNRHSMSLGDKFTTGKEGHLLATDDAKNDYIENTHVLELRIPLAPWPRCYDYNELAIMPQCCVKGGMAQEECGTPDISMNINSLMAYISCAKGRVVDFCMHPLQINRHINIVNPNVLDFLPRIGICGNVSCLINGKPVSSYNMPDGSVNLKKSMFPSDMSFKRIDVYFNGNKCKSARQHPEVQGEIEVSSKGKAIDAILDFVSDSTCHMDNSKFVGNRIEFNGFNEPVEIYSPDFSANQIPQENRHRTLLWQPYLITDKSGVAHLSFNKGSHSENVSIKIEGITKDGKFIYYNE